MNKNGNKHDSKELHKKGKEQNQNNILNDIEDNLQCKKKIYIYIAVWRENLRSNPRFEKIRKQRSLKYRMQILDKSMYLIYTLERMNRSSIQRNNGVHNF